MFIPSSGGILRRQAVSQPADGPQVPLWAFILMTAFSLILMALVGVLLWRSDIFRSLHPPDLGGKERKLSSSPTLAAPDRQEQQHEQGPPQGTCSRASSLRKAWFRSGGSFRSNIDRWRRAVDREEEARSPNAVGSSSDYCEPAVYNHASPAARPISHMQRIPEYEHQAEPKTTRPGQEW